MADDEVKVIDGVERRPIPTGQGESKTSIPLASGSMGRMLYARNSKAQLQMAIDGSGHDRHLAAAGIKTGVDADAALAESARLQREERERKLSGQGSQPKARTLYARGEEFFDTNKNRKVTIIKANSAVTKKSKTPCHLVVDRGGNQWHAKETDLVKLPGR